MSAGAAAAAAGVPAEKSPHMKTSYDAVEFDTLADVYEGLKWRMISKPGGATVKPDDFYRWGSNTMFNRLRSRLCCQVSCGAHRGRLEPLQQC